MKWFLFSCLGKNIIKNENNHDEDDIDGSVHGYSNYKIENKVLEDTIRDMNTNETAEVINDHYLDCSICLNIIYDDEYDFTIVNQNHKTECNHIFHNECIKQWYTISNGVSCPLCRANKSTEENINDMIILENLRKYICSGYCYRTTKQEQDSN